MCRHVSSFNHKYQIDTYSRVLRAATLSLVAIHQSRSFHPKFQTILTNGSSNQTLALSDINNPPLAGSTKSHVQNNVAVALKSVQQLENWKAKSCRQYRPCLFFFYTAYNKIVLSTRCRTFTLPSVDGGRVTLHFAANECAGREQRLGFASSRAALRAFNSNKSELTRSRAF